MSEVVKPGKLLSRGGAGSGPNLPPIPVLTDGLLDRDIGTAPGHFLQIADTSPVLEYLQVMDV